LRYKAQWGFTLIEVTIAVTLLALVTTVLYGAFYLGHRAAEKAQARFEENQRVRSLEELLGGYIRSAYPYRPSVRDPAIFFSGEENRLTFVSALSMGVGNRGMSKISLVWEGEENGEGLLILREKIPVHMDGQGEGGGYENSEVLHKKVAGFRIEYLDSQSQEEDWIVQWDGAEKKVLPRAIRINVVSGRGEEQKWVFPIMMSVLVL
jgi:prepilin-type N-terminal cleavage/methylation domain-containing protein